MFGKGVLCKNSEECPKPDVIRISHRIYSGLREIIDGSWVKKVMLSCIHLKCSLVFVLRPHKFHFIVFNRIISDVRWDTHRTHKQNVVNNRYFQFFERYVTLLIHVWMCLSLQQYGRSFLQTTRKPFLFNTRAYDKCVFNNLLPFVVP